MIRYRFGAEELPLAPPHEEDAGVADQLRAAASRTVRTAALAAAFVAQVGWTDDVPLAPPHEEDAGVARLSAIVRSPFFVSCFGGEDEIVPQPVAGVGYRSHLGWLVSVDGVPPFTPTPVEEDWYSAFRPLARGPQFDLPGGWATDDPSGLVATALDEGDDISTGTVELRGTAVTLFWENAEVAPIILDETHGPVMARPIVRPPVLVGRFGWDDEIVEVVPLVGLDEDHPSDLTAVVELRGPAVTLFWENTEAPPILDETQGPVLAPSIVRRPALVSRFGWDDEITQFITVDESERPVLAGPVLRPVARLAWREDDQVVEVIPPALEDEGAIHRAPRAARAAVLRLEQPDELGVSFITVDESERPVLAGPVLRPPVRAPWREDDVVVAVPPLSDEGGGVGSRPARSRVGFLRLEQPDEIAQLVIGVEDDAWLMRPGATLVAGARFLVGEEDAGPGEEVEPIDLGPPYTLTFVDPARGLSLVDPARGLSLTDPARTLEWS